MKQGAKGFIQLVPVLLVGAIIVSGIIGGIVGSLSQRKANLGALVYTTAITDTIGTFREQVNSSTANLNTELSSISSTILAYGNIVSQNTPLGVTVGGTGTTTSPTDGQILIASGSLGYYLKVVTSSASVTVSTTASTIFFNTPGFDATQNYSFTGANSFASGTTFNGFVVQNGTSTHNASTSFNATTTLNANLIGAAYIPALSFGIVTGTTSFVTSSVAFVDIGTSTAEGIASTTLSLSGTRRVLLNLTGEVSGQANTDICFFTFTQDGTNLFGSNGLTIVETLTGEIGSSKGVSMTYVTGQLSGSHTFRAQMRVSGTGCNFSEVADWSFFAKELY